MPFWRNLLSNALLFSLQDSSIKYGQHALNSRKPKDRIAGWIRRWICPGRKKASRRALPAGMTVEAAVVLPVFLFAVANLLSLFLVFWTYSSKEAQLHQTARQLALYAYGQEDGEPDVRLMRLTPVSAPFGTAAFRSSYVVNGCVMHKWIGYSGDGTGEDWERQEEELVYITKSGEAYHRERSCLYLNPSIRLADREEITADYTPCSVCVGRGRLENRLIYVTDGGSRYHNTVSRMYSVRDSYLAGNGECLGNACSNSSGGMSGKRCNPDCRKGRERRRGNAAGIRVAAGVESMRFNFVHGLSADWCRSWLRNGDRCASSEQ